MDKAERYRRAFEDLKYSVRLHLRGENADDLMRSAIEEYDALHWEAMKAMDEALGYDKKEPLE